MNAHYNVAVIGGGAGGTYAAWRLQTGSGSESSVLPADPAQRVIGLFELSDRIGGRLESLVPPEMENLRAEFGAMGFTSNDTLVNKIVAYFGLATEPFPHGGLSNLLYLRGVRFTNQQATDPTFTPPYQLPASDKAVDPRSLIPNAIEKVFPGCDKWTQQQWDKVTSQPWNGRNLSDMGFWNFLLLNMTNEEFSYARDAYGHFFEVANWNCAEALPWFMLDGHAQYTTLANGYDQLPITLAKAFVAGGGQLLMSTPVASVQNVTTGPQGQSTLEITTADGQTCTADAVILALPRRSLELIDSNVLAPVQELVASVTGQRCMKVFCCYTEDWWQQLGITAGSTGTDLPLGQVWYFGPDSASNPNSLLLATYDDTLDTSFWEGLSSGPRFPSGNGSVDPHWVEQATSTYMVDEIQRQLGFVHGIAIPQPYGASWRDWSEDPYGGAFNTWNVGVDADTVAQQILQPDSSIDLYVCGEAYSHDQGWVEGAFDTAEQVVGRIGLDTPVWHTAAVNAV